MLLINKLRQHTLPLNYILLMKSIIKIPKNTKINQTVLRLQQKNRH